MQIDTDREQSEETGARWRARRNAAADAYRRTGSKEARNAAIDAHGRAAGYGLEHDEQARP
jgi:hypothetical protein